jgi:hypothetical protein
MEQGVKYLKDYVKFHENGDYFTGSATLQYKYDIDELIKKTDSLTVLDYGCGKAVQYKKFAFDLYWGVEIDCYDPAVDEFSALPDRKYDGVLCIYVMEHVPESEVDQVFSDIFARAEKFAFIAIADHPSGKKFDSGEHIHVTMRNYDWWKTAVDRHNTKNIEVDLRVTYKKRAGE